MDPLLKLKAIAAHGDFEPDGGPPPSGDVAPCGKILPARRQKRLDPQNDLGVFHASISGGKTIPLLKTMLTTACERNCFYCPFRAGRNYRRETFKPAEMASLFMAMHRARRVEGLFLSSGIIRGGITTQDKLLDTADILRHKYGFRGYIHLKIMPGSEKDQVRQAMMLASRLSVNLEAPNEERLAQLAPRKELEPELIRPLRWIEEIRRENQPLNTWNGRWPSTATQFVVGGAGESDLELLSTSEKLLKQLRLQRVYYSAFQPVKDTPMADLPAENPLRQHRLYQSSFLFRDYGFELEELPFDAGGNLPLDEDPKLAWARAHLRDEPLEINRADRHQLLRVPGLGPRGVERILQARRRGQINGLRDLRALGVGDRRMEPFVLFNGRRAAVQMSLF